MTLFWRLQSTVKLTSCAFLHSAVSLILKMMNVVFKMMVLCLNDEFCYN